MVEINNQRKAFLDMLAWSEGTDNGRQKTRNHGYDVIVGGKIFTDYSDHPRKLVTLNPKTQINRRRTLPASFPLVGCLPQAAWPERLLSESQDAVALQQIKERNFMIDGDIRRAIKWPGSQYRLPTGFSLWSVQDMQADVQLQNSKRAERSGG